MRTLKKIGLTSVTLATAAMLTLSGASGAMAIEKPTGPRTCSGGATVTTHGYGNGGQVHYQTSGGVERFKGYALSYTTSYHRYWNDGRASVSASSIAFNESTSYTIWETLCQA